MALNISDAELQQLLKLRRNDLNITDTVQQAANVGEAINTFNHAIEDSLLKAASQLNQDQDQMMQAVVNQAAQPGFQQVPQVPLTPYGAPPIGAGPVPMSHVGQHWRQGHHIEPVGPDVVKMHVMETNIPLFIGVMGILIGCLYIVCMLKAMAGKFDMDIESIRHNQPQNKLTIDIPGKPVLNPNFSMNNLAPPEMTMGRGQGSEVLTDDSMLGDL